MTNSIDETKYHFFGRVLRGLSLHAENENNIYSTRPGKKAKEELQGEKRNKLR